MAIKWKRRPELRRRANVGRVYIFDEKHYYILSISNGTKEMHQSGTYYAGQKVRVRKEIMARLTDEEKDFMADIRKCVARKRKEEKKPEPYLGQEVVA